MPKLELKDLIDIIRDQASQCEGSASDLESMASDVRTYAEDLEARAADLSDRLADLSPCEDSDAHVDYVAIRIMDTWFALHRSVLRPLPGAESISEARQLAAKLDDMGKLPKFKDSIDAA